MRKVGLKTLKNRLSEYVRAASASETVLVTDRERVVARLVPPQTSTGESPEERYAEAVRAGLITRAKRPASGVPLSTPTVAFEDLMEELSADRAPVIYLDSSVALAHPLGGGQAASREPLGASAHFQPPAAVRAVESAKRPWNPCGRSRRG